MWTSVNLTLTLLWDDLLWWASGTWQDDPDAEPVVLAKSGRLPRGDADDPPALLAVALADLRRTTGHDSGTT